MINAEHKQYKKNIEAWNEITNIIDQTNLDELLITLNDHDTSDENKERNIKYKDRAVFYALTSQTVSGMNGLVFSKEPELDVPTQLDYLKKNIDGQGNSIYQQSRSVLKNTNSISRDGLFTSFPPAPDGKSWTKADINSGKAVATIQQITADRVINWGVESIGAVARLNLIVFKDVVSVMEDYELKETEALRELYLDGDIYKERIYVKDENQDWIAGEEKAPKDHTGKVLPSIPFEFCGAMNNDSNVDVPNMLSMARLNKAHFRNSADYEDSVWYVGQAQPWMNTTVSHVEEMKEAKMYSGSRELLPVPEGGQFAYASAPANGMVRQAMLDKEDMMVSIGAKKITPGGVAKTAEQSSNEKEMQHSPLSLIASNVSDAYTKSLYCVGLFMGVDTSKSFYKLNQELVKPNSTPAELKEMMSGFLIKTVPTADYVRYMKKQGKFDYNKSDKDYIEELDENLASNMPDLEVSSL